MTGPAPRRPKILVVDDDAGIRAGIEMLLSDGPYDVTYKSGLNEARDVIHTGAFDLIVTDLRLGSDSGLDVIRLAKEVEAARPVILMTSFSSLESAIAALRLGACEYIIKPFNNDEFLHACNRALDERRLRQENAILRRSLRKSRDRKAVVGQHPKILRVMEMVRKVAAADANVLIFGASGTGKELVAQALHYDSPRAEGPLVTVNCGAIPAELVEAELFGHVKGAFSGAVANNEGLIREAHNGTLFLDEIGDLPLPLQVKFLRVLEDKQVRAVGARDVHLVDVRFVAATNKDLKQAVVNGQFREDLYYRLDVIELHVPPLRERGRDVDLLARHFIDHHAARMGKRITGLDREFTDFIHSYEWPGNVRELENLIERAVILADGEVLVYADLADGLIAHAGTHAGTHASSHTSAPDGDGDATAADAHSLSIEGYIKQVVLKYQDSLSEVEMAAMLGIGRKALWMRRRRWGLQRQARGAPETAGNTREPIVSDRNA